MFIPPLQHELVEDLWDYEQNFMSMQELLKKVFFQILNRKLMECLK